MNSKFAAKFGEPVQNANTSMAKSSSRRGTNMSFAKYFEEIPEASCEEGSSHRKASRNRRQSHPSQVQNRERNASFGGSDITFGANRDNSMESSGSAKHPEGSIASSKSSRKNQRKSAPTNGSKSLVTSKARRITFGAKVIS